MEDRGHRKVVIIEEDRNPFELWVMGALFLSCFLFLIGVAPPPTSVEAAVTSEFWRWLWYVQIFAGTVFVIACTFFFNKWPVLRKQLQVFGYIQVASGTFVYAGAVFFYAGPAGTGSGSLIGCVGLACIFRIYQVRKQINALLKRYEEWSRDTP